VALLVAALLVPAAQAAPTILRLGAQPLGIGGVEGVVATGLVDADRVHVQYLGRCVGTKLSDGDDGRRRFTLVVKTSDGRCASRAIQRGWIRASACGPRDCVATVIRISHFRDSDGDGLNNLLERWVYRTSPANRDSDGDGVPDGREVAAGTDPKDAASHGSPSSSAAPGPGAEGSGGGNPPSPPPPDTTPPQTMLKSGPSGIVAAAGATFSFASNEAGATFACRLDGGGWSACGSPKTYVALANGEHAFEVRATDRAGNTDPTPATRAWTIDVPPPAFGCADGATDVTTEAMVRGEVDAKRSVCVVAEVGNVDLSDLGNRAGVVISTEGAGSMGSIDVSDGTTDLTIRGARFRSIELRGADRTTLLGNTIGGSPDNRVLDQLIFMPDESNDVTIEGNDIGWTEADNSGNTGYGCRCYGELNGLRFVGNKIHDIAADGFQGVGGANVLIDRNEIGPVGANPGSSEHSDNIQLTFNGPDTRVTNNWIHHQGYFEGSVTGNSGSVYIHGGTSSSLLFENNLIETAQGRTEICGLGTGGTTRSNIAIRNNTWIDGGRAFSAFPGFEWDCDSGTGNAVERNIAVDPDGGFAQSGSEAAAIFADNLWGQPALLSFDAGGNCTSASCNPAGQAPIGYRKPSGIAW
jgi:Bacterial TSP3 repeat/Right handed beta helix region